MIFLTECAIIIYRESHCKEAVYDQNRTEKKTTARTRYITHLNNYIKQQKTKLPEAVINTLNLTAEFDWQCKVYMRSMCNKVNEYETQNRMMYKELKNFYDKMMRDVMKFANELSSMV